LDRVKEQDIMRIHYSNALSFFERLLCKTGSFLGPFWGAVLISLSTGLAIWVTGVFMKQYKAEAILRNRTLGGTDASWPKNRGRFHEFF